MPSKVVEFTKQKQINPPSWILKPESVIYEVVTGSQAYGIANENSDYDLYCIVVPPKEIVFPHLDGYIVGFDKDIPKFTTHQNKNGKKCFDDKNREYDIQIYSIIEFFRFATENNPNIIDSLFVNENCIIHMNDAGKLLRENRKVFLNKGSLFKFLGYAYSQLSKMKSKTPESKRFEAQEQYGFCPKFATHVVRLLNELWQILATGDLSLTQNNDILKSIRRGEWTEQRIRDYFTTQEPLLKGLYERSELPHSPDMPKIRSLLLDVLEASYGSLYCASCALSFETVTNNENNRILKQIRELIK